MSLCRNRANAIKASDKKRGNYTVGGPRNEIERHRINGGRSLS